MTEDVAQVIFLGADDITEKSSRDAILYRRMATNREIGLTSKMMRLARTDLKHVYFSQWTLLDPRLSTFPFPRNAIMALEVPENA